MAEKISNSEVQKIAQLARLELTDAEVDQYAKELSAILGYIGQLSEVDTKNTAITSQVTGLSNVMREDTVDACDNPEELVALAPEHKDGLIKVKAVFDA
ncbi:MAG: Asp-tRNA(Asn)/Glu-tRNA(Gln) amidotransferase subunit GatC [Parcubacteria group bacterium]|nr:Asp-tRNA(Asn)/Glu-tRNA(Gln) amidotransferase subunit GatC [Parcubacteria group bacterium]